MLVSVTERTREVDYVALGASEEAILTQFVMEAVLLSLVGGLIGVLLGLWCSCDWTVSPVKPEVTVWSVLLAVGVSVGAGIFFGVFPAQEQQSRSDYRLTFRLKEVTMPWFEHVRIAVQALWANRLRSMLTMLGLIIGVSATILVLALGLALRNFS